jgi:NADH-quinone oxidoreductase subunit H
VIEPLEKLFVNMKHLAVGVFPEAWQPLVSVMLTIAPILLVFPLLFAFTTVIERKGLGRIQNRLGPNRVGLPFTNLRLFGFGQFIADGLKMLTKEDVVPRAADKVLHFWAPILLIVPVLLSYAVLPFGKYMVPIELDAGLLFFFAVGASTELAVFLAGWSSRNKYALLGAMRGIAQMISYEIPLIVASLTVVMMTGSLSLVEIVERQDATMWNVVTPWGLAGFVLFLIAATAEANRSPFDLPEAESEIIAGYFVEYSGFKFALFFLGEYLGLFAMSGLAITLFLGGWSAPFDFLYFIPSYAWFFLKLFALLAVFIWVRGTLPRLRSDQLMNFAWKFMLPMTLINIVVAGVWKFGADEGWHFVARWILCAALLAAPYWLLGRGLESRVSRRRVYRFAD